MTHLIAWHQLPRINLALVIAVVWGALAVAAAIYDVGHMIAAW
jgi:hypothetical protein